MDQQKSGFTGLDEQDVRAALEFALASEELRRSPQLAAFLAYVVEAVLDGHPERIKAYSIAVDVFGRPESFDPQSDPIVRVQARRLRDFLDRFFLAPPEGVRVGIKLPVGSYVPHFPPLQPAAASARIEETPLGASAGAQPGIVSPSNPLTPPVKMPDTVPEQPARTWRGFVNGRGSDIVAGALIAFIVLLSALRLAGLSFEKDGGTVIEVMPDMPTIVIGEFVNQTGDARLDTVAAGIGPQLAGDLSRFENVVVRQLADAVRPGAHQNAGEFRVSGLVRRVTEGYELTALLTRGTAREIVWSTAQTEDTTVSELSLTVPQFAQSMAALLGGLRGPLHLQGRQYVSEHPDAVATDNTYVCVLRFLLAREAGDPRMAMQAMRCLDRLIEANANNPMAVAARASLMAVRSERGAQPGDNLSARMEVPLAEARRAVDLLPSSSFAREQLGHVMFLADLVADSRTAFEAALARNPANCDARAGLALVLALNGDWSKAETFSLTAVRMQPVPAPWHQIVPALVALRQQDYTAAVSAAQVVAQANFPLGVVLVLAAAPLAGRSDLVARYAPIVLNEPEFQNSGIIPRLSVHVHDEDLLRILTYGLTLAGLPRDLIMRGR